MARTPRVDERNLVYHVLNRANSRRGITVSGTVLQVQLRSSAEELEYLTIRNITELPLALSSKKFDDVTILFIDLDGTLHDFRKTARVAMEVVYREVQEKYSLNLAEMQRVYADIIREAEKAAFADRRTSHEYRRERFTKLLSHFDIQDEPFVYALEELYGSTFESNLFVADETKAVLAQLARRYTLYMITEGPRDAQLRTVDGLGIGKHFRKIYTSNEYGERKESGGLFTLAQHDIGVPNDQIVVIGDVKERDVKGAQIAGIKAILCDGLP